MYSAGESPMDDFFVIKKPLKRDQNVEIKEGNRKGKKNIEERALWLGES